MLPNLNHTCTIQRATETTRSASNLPVVSWTDYIVDQICRYTPRRVDEQLRNEEAFDSIVELAILILPYNVSITERDRITNIRISPTETLTDNFEIIGMSYGQNHVGTPITRRLVLKRVT